MSYADTIEPSAVPAGKRMGPNGHHLVLGPEEAIERELVDLIRVQTLAFRGDYGRDGAGRPNKKPTNWDAGRRDGWIRGLARALVWMKAGSDWINGAAPETLIQQIRVDIIAELDAKQEQLVADLTGGQP